MFHLCSPPVSVLGNDGGVAYSMACVEYDASAGNEDKGGSESALRTDIPVRDAPCTTAIEHDDATHMTHEESGLPHPSNASAAPAIPPPPSDRKPRDAFLSSAPNYISPSIDVHTEHAHGN